MRPQLDKDSILGLFWERSNAEQSTARSEKKSEGLQKPSKKRAAAALESAQMATLPLVLTSAERLVRSEPESVKTPTLAEQVAGSAAAAIDAVVPL